MKSIIKIKFHDMRNLEFRGVQYQLLQMAQDIKTPGASSFIEDFRSSFQEMCQHFDSGLQDSPDRRNIIFPYSSDKTERTYSGEQVEQIRKNLTLMVH